jgi:hypothetical protein
MQRIYTWSTRSNLARDGQGVIITGICFAETKEKAILSIREKLAEAWPGVRFPHLELVELNPAYPSVITLNEGEY